MAIHPLCTGMSGRPHGNSRDHCEARAGFGCAGGVAFIDHIPRPRHRSGVRDGSHGRLVDGPSHCVARRNALRGKLALSRLAVEKKRWRAALALAAAGGLRRRDARPRRLSPVGPALVGRRQRLGAVNRITPGVRLPDFRETAKGPEGEPDETFDAIIGRLVLFYVADPASVLRRLSRSLRQGGVMAFHEYNVPPLAQAPASPLFAEVRRWILEGFKLRRGRTGDGLETLLDLSPGGSSLPEDDLGPAGSLRGRRDRL